MVPISDAGDDISEIVTSCVDKDVIISVDGSNSSVSGVGVCDTGVCSNDIKYCTTSLGPTDEICGVDENPTCGDTKVCVGGSNEGLDCTDDEALCGTGSCDLLKQCLSKYSHQSYCHLDNGVWDANYEFISEDECDALEGISNHKWYDYSLTYEWISNGLDLSILIIQIKFLILCLAQCLRLNLE